MNIKMIALDMDETTLLGDYRSISKRNKAAIEAAIEKGIEVVPATGRARSLIPESITSIEGLRYLVTANGALVLDLKDDRVVSSTYIGAGTVRKIVSMLRRKNQFYEIFYQGNSYVEKNFHQQIKNIDQFNPEHLEFVKTECLPVDSIYNFALEHAAAIEKIDVSFLSDHDFRIQWQKLSRYKSVFLASPLHNSIEVTSSKTNKGQGLKQLCLELGIKAHDVMAIGDSDNDMGMFKYVGFPVAVANATPELKALAKAQTLSYLDDGVAHAIEKYVL